MGMGMGMGWVGGCKNSRQKSEKSGNSKKKLENLVKTEISENCGLASNSEKSENLENLKNLKI